MFKITTLDNGLKVVTYEHRDALTCSLEVNVLSGSYFSPIGKEGLSHFLEHMIMNGTENYPSPAKIYQSFERIGGMLSASTGKIEARYKVKVRGDNWEKAAQLLFSLLSDPLLNEREIAGEKKIIAEEIARSKDNLGIKVYNELMQLAFKDNTLLHEVLGYVETINSFDIRGIKSFYEDRYKPQNTVIYSAGRLSHNQVVNIAREVFPGRKDGGINLGILDLKVFPKLPGPKASVLNDPANQAKALLFFPSIASGEEEFIKINALSYILQKDLKSRIREKENMAYDIRSGIFSYGNLHLMYVDGGLNYEKIREALTDICEELKKIRESGLDEEKLELVKINMESDLLFDLERPGGWISFAAEFDRAFGNPINVEEYLKYVKRISVEDIRELAKKIFVSKNAYLAVSHREVISKELEDILQRGLS